MSGTSHRNGSVTFVGLVALAGLIGCAQDPVNKAAHQSADYELTPAQRAAVGRHLQRCWESKPGLYGDSEGMRPYPEVLLDLTTDDTGTVRKAVVAPENKGDMSHSGYAHFVSNAIASALDPACAKLPLPPAVLGRQQTFLVTFGD